LRVKRHHNTQAILALEKKMFSVYGTTGQTFRGTLEGLMPLTATLKSRNTPHRDDTGFDASERPTKAGHEKQSDSDEQAKFTQAARAYDKMHRQENKRLPVCHAYQLMSHDVLTLRPTDTVGAAWLQLVARGVRQAPVLGPKMEVVGLVSDRDLLTVANLEGNLLTGLLNRPIRELMVTPVACSAPVTDVRRIARVLLATGLSALPIVDDAGELLGIVSRGDILRASVKDPPLSLWI